MKNDNFDIQDLIFMELAGETSEEEKMYLLDLISNDKEIKELWEEMSAHHSSPEVQRLISAVDSEELWCKIKDQTTPKRPNKPIYRVLRNTSIAASLVLLLGFWHVRSSRQVPVLVNNVELFIDSSKARICLGNGEVIYIDDSVNRIALPNGPVFNNNNGNLNFDAGNHAPDELITLYSASSRVDTRMVLSDGTEVILNANTKLVFPVRFKGKFREITLDGEAYLKVAKNTTEPFIVNLPKGEIQVLGTEFNVNSYNIQQTMVSLYKGSVNLNVGNEKIKIDSGFQVTYGNGSHLQTCVFDREEVLNWKKGIYMRTNASLEEIASILRRWYGLEVVVDNAGSPSSTLFYMTIDRHLPVEKFLDNMKATEHFGFHYKGQVLHLYPR